MLSSCPTGLRRLHGVMGLTGSRSISSESCKTPQRTLRHWPARAVSPTTQLPALLPAWGLLAVAAFMAMGLPVLVVATKRRTPTMASKSSEREGLSSAWRIASRLTFGSARSRRSFILIVLLFISLALANTAAVAQSFAQRDYMTALSQKQAALFFNKLGLAMVLLAATMPFRSLAEFAAGGLTIVWRDALTDGLLRDYFRPKVVYWLRHESNVPDPDMRIAVEAGHFADMLVLMIRDVFENVLKLSGFLGVMYSISPLLCLVMASYAAVGALATVKFFGAPLVRIDRSIKSQEAAFRKSIARCLDRAEPLCLCGGEPSESAESRGRYLKLQQQQWARTFWRTSLGTFREFFSWAAYLLPVAIVSPLWLQDKVPFGTVPQAIMAFQVSLGALTVVVRKFRSVSALIAEGSRLEGLVQALAAASRRAQNPLPAPEISKAAVEVDGLSLSLPDGSFLYRQLSFQLKPGESLVVFGPSGAGKTTLIRALAGLWAGGSGSLRHTRPVAFLPQDPYMPEGSLRRVLSFPLAEHTLRDEDILAAAQCSCLGDVIARHGEDLEVVADWEAVLSRGERQRCAFCRLLLLRPNLAILDEATSALDEPTEEALYQQLLSLCAGMSFVSITHRPALQRFHTHVLRFEVDESGEASGKFEVNTAATP
ncbi:unnamed protein product [Symbiodinium natans]|uniref:ATP-dependent transporter ycf16 n=1 Tax=Symbiodinium natans TaxID=878477 RepID=A0A812JN60_9DINO|nr:unnamed protein product [Symbiodinium natans]